MSRITTLTAVVAACAIAACSKGNGNVATTDTTTSAAAGTVARPDSAAAANSTATVVDTAAEAKTNADIFATLHAANTGEIAAARIAETKATNVGVKQFAHWMVKDHTTLDTAGAALAKRLNITPVMKDSGMVKDARDEAKDLRSKKVGADWDQDYIGKQVDDHQKVLDYITKSINDTHNSDIKTMLQQAQPKVQAHLDSAKALKDKIKA